MTFRKYLVLAGVSLFAACGDSLLAAGMKKLGSIGLRHLADIFLVVLHPEIALGVLLLFGFFACYIIALSWADLTYVLPATSLSYVLVALIARFLLHETVSLTRWGGILLIAGGVGFVTRGPALTQRARHECLPETVSTRAQ